MQHFTMWYSFSCADSSEDDEIPWWISRGDYQPLGTVTDAVRVDSSCSQERLQDDSEEEKSSGMPQCESAAQFTEYSISSSVVPRNDGMYTNVLVPGAYEPPNGWRRSVQLHM